MSVLPTEPPDVYDEPACGDENQSYGPGNPDWEHDRGRELEDDCG